MTMTTTTVTMTTSSNGVVQQPFLDALRKHRVKAEVKNTDHYRVKGGMAVQTDFIILVHQDRRRRSNPETDDGKDEEGLLFDPFMVSKTYHSFRKLAESLKSVAAAAHKKCWSSTSSSGGKRKSWSISSVNLAQYCEFLEELIESQPTQYLAKVSYGQVRKLAKERSEIINQVLQATCQNFPDLSSTQTEDDAFFVSKVASIVETFFLTDVCSTKAGSHIKRDKDLQESRDNSQPFMNILLNPLSGITRRKSMDGAISNGSSANNSFNSVPSFARQSLHRTSSSSSASFVLPASASQVSPSTAVRPLTRRDRPPRQRRESDELELEKQEGQLLFVEDHEMQKSFRNATATTKPTPTPSSRWYPNINDSNVWYGFAFIGTALVILSRSAKIRLALDADIELLLLFAAYCLGLHTAKLTHFSNAAASPDMTRPHLLRLPDKSGRRLIRRSLIKTSTTPKSGTSAKSFDTASDSTATFNSSPTQPTTTDLLEMSKSPTIDELMTDESSEDEGFPMSEFPPDAELGTVTNCWGRCKSIDFKIRGPNYLKDKKKIPSEDFLFRLRGVELLLTDTCPANIGRNTRLLHGKLRDCPTFILNLRLPWGLLISYYEIPEKFIPYIEACYDKDRVDRAKLEASLQSLTPGERCLCRFIMNDSAYKNRTIKIVPVVIKGPWVVKQVVDGKPALLGNKLPIDYFYEAAEGSKAMYWEADLDIAASPAARGILSLVRSYTNILTLDLGFVVQGNTEDELPEQMLIGFRLHGADPLTAPAYPMPEDMASSENSVQSNGKTTPASPGK